MLPNLTEMMKAARKASAPYPFLLTPMREGEKAIIVMNGTSYSRKVRYNKRDGLYVVIGNQKYFEYEFGYEFLTKVV